MNSPILRFALLVLFFGLSSLSAQVVSSGLTGLIRAPDGRPVSAAEIVVTHTPTGTVYTTRTNESGRFYLRSLIVGGPFIVTASVPGKLPSQLTEVYTNLGADAEVDLMLSDKNIGDAAGAADEVVKLDKVVITADSNDLDASAMGSGTTLGSQRLASRPSTQRSIADLASSSALVTLRNLSGDREEAQISAVGQNNRYNSILIDGVRINDQFGLNGSGLASFFNPISIDTIDQLSVQISPYDTRQSGFTGASINAITKSGTNEFKGTAYYLFSGDEFLGFQLQGEDARDRVLNNRKTVQKLERTTYGFTFGGPIIKNRLFFFLNFEDFERIQPPSDPGLNSIAPADLTTINNALTALNAASGRDIDWGTLSTSPAPTITNDEKRLAKIDWNINRDHRLSVGSSLTEGALPQYGGYTRGTTTGSSNDPLNSPSNGRTRTIAGGSTTAYTSNFFEQLRPEESWSGQLFSQWTRNFKTELKYATTTQDQITTTGSVAPEIRIFGVTGLSRSGSEVRDPEYPANPDGVIVLGTEFNRQGNDLKVDTSSYSATGDYLFRNFVFTGGFDREETDFLNLFRSGSYGSFDFASPAAFAAGTINGFQRINVYDPAVRPAADLSEFAITGLFAQTRWDVSPRLSTTFGLRYDFAESPIAPAFNQAWFNLTGERNDGTIDGSALLAPRLSFNLAMTPERTLQLRGGFGLFQGRAPWVFFSNSYNRPGVGTFNLPTTPPASLADYLRNSFDPANPVGTGVDNPTLRRELNYAEQGIALPSVWRGNLALDYKLPVLSSTFTVEYVHTDNYETFFIDNPNLRPIGTGADGRARFAGRVDGSANAANALYPAFENVYRIRNISSGRSQYVSLSWERAMKDRWGYSLSYTRGKSTEAQSFGQTTAGSQWGRIAVFNQNQVEVFRSDFEVKDRVQASLTREFEFIKKWRTSVSLYYEGRSGIPYSWVYSTDLNGDGRQDNDLVAIPTDVNGQPDARFDFTAMSTADREAYFAFIRENGLDAFAGSYVPRNAHFQPWTSRLDLRFSQKIPLYAKTDLELFFDFINFGSFLSKDLFNYTEIAPLIETSAFWRRSLGAASYTSAGRIAPSYSATTPPNGRNFILDDTQSRWRIQLGARLRF